MNQCDPLSQVLDRRGIATLNNSAEALIEQSFFGGHNLIEPIRGTITSAPTQVIVKAFKTSDTVLKNTSYKTKVSCVGFPMIFN